jgi:autotransporter-associated beta strand protein/T5SS/PEP-CTERM-associated repeat protein
MFRPLPFALLFSIPLVSPADDVEITGNVTPSPATTPTWTIPGQLVIGLTGDGTLAISGTGAVANTSGIIANGASSVSSVSVSGGSWTNSSFLAIGVGGSGTLEISGTGDVSSTTTSLASNAGSSGSLQLLGGTLTTGQVFEGSGNGIVTFNGGTLRLSGNQNALFSGFENGDVTLAGAGTIDTQAFQVATGLDLGGLGSLTKAGSGALTLTGTNNYSGGTTIAAGTLLLGNGGTTGSVTGSVSNHGTLVFNRSDDLTFAGAISGTGNVTHQGGGTLTLSNASSSYTGVTTVSGGVLSVIELEDGGVNSAIGAASGAAANLVLDGGTLRFTRASTWFSNRLFTLGAGGGTLEAAGAGTASFVDSSFGGIGFTGTGARTLTLTGAGNGQFQRRALTDSGSGATGMTKDGTGTWTWSLLGENHLSYTGATNVNSGTLVLNYATTSSSRTLNSAVTIADGAEFRINHGVMLLGSLAGAGTIRVGRSGDDLAQLIVGLDNTDTTFSGTIEPLSGFVGTNIALAKRGTGTMTIVGTQSRTGYTLIQDGVLSIDSIANGGVASGLGASSNAAGNLNFSRGGTLRYTGAEASTDRRFVFIDSGSSARTIESNGTGPLHFTNTDAIGSLTMSTVTFALSGSADGTFAPVLPSDLIFRKEGTGTWTITGNNIYTGGTTISGGILEIGNGGTSGSITGNVTNNSSLVFNRSDDVTFGGVISGSGNLTKQGAGVLALSGDNNYTGQTRVQEGTLSILGNTGVSEVIVDPGATLAGTGTVQNISLLDGGWLAPGSSIGTLNAASLRWNAGALTMAGSGDFLFTFEDLGWEAGQTYTLIEFGNTNFTVDDFGFTNTGGFDGSFLLDESSLKFTVATIPEPGTTAPLLLGLMLLAARRRRTS